ncbi:MAG: hypothetical protein K2M31_08865 [Muribaculaceae bacterium]|nr:hypothetical protein [Muribaculaceae bacterium]
MTAEQAKSAESARSAASVTTDSGNPTRSKSSAKLSLHRLRESIRSKSSAEDSGA